MRKHCLRVGTAVAVAVVFCGQVGAYEAIEVNNGGALSGRVVYSGEPPRPRRIEVTKDTQVCGKEKTAPDLVVGPDRGIANAVVRLNIEKGKKLELPSKNPVLDQRGCEFRPHVLLFPAGATVDIWNSDGILHNIHTVSRANPPVNKAQPKFRKVIKLRFDKPEFPVRVRCDAHGWMSAWFVVEEHPYYAVTDARGAFRIAEIPPGSYEVEVWHEVLGKATHRVTIRPGAVSEVTFTLGNN